MARKKQPQSWRWEELTPEMQAMAQWFRDPDHQTEPDKHHWGVAIAVLVLAFAGLGLVMYVIIGSGPSV